MFEGEFGSEVCSVSVVKGLCCRGIWIGYGGMTEEGAGGSYTCGPWIGW